MQSGIEWAGQEAGCGAEECGGRGYESFLLRSEAEMGTSLGRTDMWSSTHDNNNDEVHTQGSMHTVLYDGLINNNTLPVLGGRAYRGSCFLLCCGHGSGLHGCWTLSCLYTAAHELV